MDTPRRSAFTIIELLVVVSIIAALLAILLPAIRSARDTSKVTVSSSNLRNLAAAHGAYSATYGDRQLTYVADTIASYGNTAPQALAAYKASNHGIAHHGVSLGWGVTPNGQRADWHFDTELLLNETLIQPIVFNNANGLTYFGAFRLPNGKVFSQFLSGRFYDPTFFAPKDVHVIEAVGMCFDDPGEFCPPEYADVTDEEPFCLHPLVTSNTPVWASYVLSPAAMFNPAVMARNDPDNSALNGWVDPWSISSGMRSPAPSQARYPNLKTRMLEHHWLQAAPDNVCNPGFQPGTYGGCEPYYFHHSSQSAPMTLFYDGHVGPVGVSQAVRADARVQAQTGGTTGLWSRDTPFGPNGYFSDYGHDNATTNFHILTTDGILGRDIMD